MYKNNKGITLIALVITIIVMIILVGVTISMAVNGGLFSKAGEAVGDTKNSLTAEGQLADGGIEVDGEWYNSIDEYLSSRNNSEGVDLNLLNVGDYVNYPVEYTNVATSYDDLDGEGSEYPLEKYTGWRILSKETDEQGNILYIKLVSAGVPLSFYHYFEPDKSIQALTTNFLTTEITSTATEFKFYKCGFKNVTETTLQSTFTNKFTDKVQSLTKEDLEKAIEDLEVASFPSEYDPECMCWNDLISPQISQDPRMTASVFLANYMDESDVGLLMVPDRDDGSWAKGPVGWLRWCTSGRLSKK